MGDWERGRFSTDPFYRDPVGWRERRAVLRRNFGGCVEGRLECERETGRYYSPSAWRSPASSAKRTMSRRVRRPSFALARVR